MTYALIIALVLIGWWSLAGQAWRTRNAPQPEMRSRGPYGEDGQPGDDGSDRS